MLIRRDQHPRFKIKALSKQLRKLSFPTSPISIDLARFAADAFDKVLAGKSLSLDEAFGLRKHRGAPREFATAKKQYELAKEIFALRQEGKTWYEIEDELGRDQGYLRKLYKRIKLRLSSRKIRSILDNPNTPSHE